MCLLTQDSIATTKGVMDCVRKTIAKEGALGLYSGAASPLLGAMAHNAGVRERITSMCLYNVETTLTVSHLL